MMMQRGMVLVTVLIFLLVLTFLAIAALTTGQLQTRMSHNLSDNLNQFHNAEAGLYEGEKLLTSSTKITAPCFSPAPLVAKFWLDKNIKTCVLNNTDNTEIKTYFYIEKLPVLRCVRVESTEGVLNKKGNYYRVTSWVSEGKKQSVVLQSTYVVASDNPCKQTFTAKNQPILPGRLSWREVM